MPTKESDKKEIKRVLHRMIASPFRAILGDGGGTVSVAGKTGWVWARRLGQEEKVFQAFNRGVGTTNEGRVVLVQESRVEGLPGYEVVGSAGGDAADLSSHMASDPFDGHGVVPSVRISDSVYENIPNNAVTYKDFDTIDEDSLGTQTNLTNNYLVCQQPGTYLLGFNVRWRGTKGDGGGGGNVALGNFRRCIIQRQPGGTGAWTDIYADARTAVEGTRATDQGGVGKYVLTINDNLRLEVFHVETVAGTVDILSQADISPKFWMVRVA